MSEKHLVVCDSCGKEADGHSTSDNYWYKVQTAITGQVPQRLLRDLERVQAGDARMEDIVAHGDFCSLACLANWASAQQEMRQLARDLNEGQSFDTELPPDAPLGFMDALMEATTPEEFAERVAELTGVNAEVIEVTDDPDE